MNHFQILALIGQGAFSKVYKVRRVEDGNIYALKKMALSQLTQNEKQHCLNEIRLLAKISHPNIIQYKEAFMDENHLCLVMELAENGDFLEFMIKRRKMKQPFSEQEICVFAREMANGLAALHKTNIIHRDVKAANFFISADNQVKLGDMNVSSISRNGMALTKIGTPFYTSPEIWLEKPYSTAADLWAFGCLLYEMITFSRPFNGRDAAQIKKAVLEGKFDPLPAHVSPQLAKIIEGCLVIDSSERVTATDVISNAYIKKKYNEFKQATMQKDPMNFKNHTITCARILKEISAGNARLNLPPKNYLSKQKAKLKHSNSQSRSKSYSRSSKKPINQKLVTMMQIYNQKDFLTHRGCTLPPRARLIR